MKKSVMILTILLTGSLLAACGDNAEQEDPWIDIAPGSDLTDVTERTEYYDLFVETEDLFDVELWEKNPEAYYSGDIEKLGITVYNLLSTQFAKGEPSQLWSVVSPAGVDIYLYRTDGSRELLLSRLSDDDCSFVDARYAGYMDNNRNCYFYVTNWPEINRTYTPAGTIMKILPTGEILYQNSLEPGFSMDDIRQTEDGRIYVLLADP